MAAAKAIAPVPIPIPRVGLGAAADDVTTLQQLLQEMATTGTFPTESQLQAAQAAVTSLSTEVPGMTGAPTVPAAPATPTAPAASGTLTIAPVSVILMVAGAALLGGGIVYLGVTGKKKRRS